MLNFFSKKTKTNTNKELYGPNVAVVAIAKDEGAYIHEWIHHYLFKGFKKIFIGINRTTDNTLDILEKVQKKYPNVFVFQVDWLDQGCLEKKNPQMQSLTYAFLSNVIVTKHREISHIFYCDIDEFWFDKAFTKSISSYLNELPSADTISFNWLNQYGDSDDFQKPFFNLRVSADRHMKSIHKVSTLEKIVEFRCHASKYNVNVKHIDCNGNPISYGEHDQVFKYVPAVNSSAFVLHRMVRSQLEYTALLLRERPGVEIPIKNNRNGFSIDSDTTIFIDPDALSLYWDSLEFFIEYCGLKDSISISRRELKEKSKRILDVKPNVLIAHLGSYLKVLRGTPYYDKILDILEAGDGSYLIDEYAKKLFDIAISLETDGKIDLAIRYMKLAHRARPSGPVIKENLDRLLSL